jgi:hypothetical protein
MKKGFKMTTKQPVANYSAEVTAEIVIRYAAGETVEALATFAGKSTRSIVAKLSREGVYTSKAKTKAEARTTKGEFVAQIAEAMGVDEEALDSLEKATASALKLVLTAVTK